MTLKKKDQCIQALFEAAIELPTEDQAPFVRQQCGDDLELEQRIQQLLAAAAKASSPLIEPLHLWDAVGGEDVPEPPPDASTDDATTDLGTPGDRTDPMPVATHNAQNVLLPGTVVAHYELIRKLGYGGMGAVYLARDRKLGRRVAMKFLHSNQSAIADRFLAEARATARCEHENIVSIHHADEAYGQPYMVLEYVEGTTLREWIRDRWQDGGATQDLTRGSSASLAPEPRQDTRVSSTLAVELMVPVVRALDHAHRLGLVHRDLKPENIMLADDGTIKVLDFGIAKVLDREQLSLLTSTQTRNRDTTPETQRGALLGTRPYMSPEQWGADDVDARSDLWAVGLILWELCTGRHPLAPFTFAKFMMVADLEIPMAAMRDERPELGVLAEIIDHCLAKRKAERMPSAAALLQVLEPLLPGRRTAQRSSEIDVGVADEADNPYVGLAAFQEQDTARFFGRDREISSIVNQLRHHRMLTVASASGTGKSSFVRAGVLPALARSGQHWEWFIVRPGREPLAGLARVLADIDKDGAGDIASDKAESSAGAGGMDPPDAILRTEPGALGTILRARSRRRRTRILLFVDQFEELYTLGVNRDMRELFVRCLEGVADDASSPLRVVLSMRSDFLDRVAEDRSFMGEITRGLWLLPPMQRDALRQALVSPLERVGYRLEHQEQMVDTMLNALEDTRVPLPLLQFTATHLWDLRDRDRRRITAASYEQLGGVAGALSMQADTVLAGLAANEQRLARLVFTSLVTEERTRAIVSLDELRALSPRGEMIDELVQRLAEARLLLIETDVQKGDVTAELCHESLINGWPQLGRWLSEDQEVGAFHSRLRAAAREWHNHNRSEDMLWRGQAADDARLWTKRWRAQMSERGTKREQMPDSDGLDGVTTAASAGWADLSERDRGYLDAVVALANRTQRRRRRLFAAAFAMVSVIAIVIAVLANRATQQASLAAAESIRARNASRMASAREYQSDTTLALALIRELEPADELPKRWQEMALASMYMGVAEVVLHHQDVVCTAEFSPDGLRIVTASNDQTALVWNADGTGTPLVLRGHENLVMWAAFSPNGRRIVTASLP